MKAEDKKIANYGDAECYAYQRGYRHGAEAEREISYKAGQRDMVEYCVARIGGL